MTVRQQHVRIDLCSEVYLEETPFAVPFLRSATFPANIDLPPYYISHTKYAPENANIRD